jgi:transcription elongation factor GreA
MYFILPFITVPTLSPACLRDLKTLVRDLKAQSGLQVQRVTIVENGKVSLAALTALRPPRRGVAAWLQAQLDRAAPGFFESCVSKQAASAQVRKQARKHGNETNTKAPLAGVLVGGKERYPELYAAFYAAVKAAIIAGHQAVALKDGLAFAGVKTGDRVGVTTQDFMSPLTVTTGEGCDVDLRAEGALARLARVRMEMGRVHDGEEVRSRGEEGLEEAKQFAHSEFQILPEALIKEVAEQEGLIIPWDASSRDARALAEGIDDPYLRGRVLDALDRSEDVDDRERVYLHAGGQPAFRVRKTTPAAPWKPYEPTPDHAEDDPELDASDSPFAGWSAFDAGERKAKSNTPALGRTVSQETYDAMHAQLAQLLVRKDEIAALMGNALEDGDLRESAAYDEARSLMMENQRAIAKAELALLDVQVGDVASTNVGKTLTVSIDGVERDVKLTDHLPRLPQQGFVPEVSVDSPMGQALLHAEAGQTFTVDYTVKSTRPMRVRDTHIGDTITVRRQVPAGVRAPILPDTLRVYTSVGCDIRFTTTKTVSHHVKVLALA